LPLAREMSIVMDMKRVSIAEAKQTLPALVHETERRGEIELTRRGRTVAYLVSAERHARLPARSFVDSMRAWIERYGADVGVRPLALPRRKRARRVEIPR
jgi:prevent-host-death family protein